MEALKREGPSAGFHGFCSVKSVLQQELKKKSALWGMEQGKAVVLSFAV